MTERRLVLVAAIVLALATVATAWAAFQARQWTGEQSQGYSRGTAARIAENRAAALANRQVQIDVATFIQWVDARQQRRPRLASFYRARFRPEFQPAFSAWLATEPFTDADAPPTPFALPQYRLAATVEAEGLAATAAAASEQAKDANRRADDYMLAVVLFASSLFFSGLSAKVDGLMLQRTMLGLGTFLLVATFVWVVSLPVQLTL